MLENVCVGPILSPLIAGSVIPCLCYNLEYCWENDQRLIRYQYLYWRFWREKINQFWKSNIPSAFPFLCPSLHWASAKFNKLHIWAILLPSNNNNNNNSDNNMIHVLEHARAKLTSFVIPIEHWQLRGFKLPNQFHQFKNIYCLLTLSEILMNPIVEKILNSKKYN